MYPYMFNGFQPQMPQMQQQYIPQQQIIQVNGKASIDTMRLPPNSSVLVMDTSAPMVWMCVSDGVGRVTATPYDISVHQETEKQEAENMEKRIAKIEVAIEEMEEKINAKSNDGTASNATSKTNGGYDENRRQPSGYAQQPYNDQSQYAERDGFREW